MLSAEDRLAIEDLYARSYWANDSGDAEGWIDTFHDGAVIFHDDRPVQGKDELRKYIRKRLDARAGQASSLHFVTNLLLEGGSDIARGRCYFLRLAKEASSGEWFIQTAGWYEDEIERVSGRWGFTSRRASHDVPTRQPR
jgi:hypothetical protein